MTESAQTAIPRDQLPAGSGTIDEPDETSEVEETLEAFRQLSGEAENAPAQPPPAASDPEQDEYAPVPEDEGFSLPLGEPTAEAPPVEAREAPQPGQPPVEQQPPEVQPVPPQAAPAAPAPAAEPDPQATFTELSRQLDENLGAFQQALADRVYTISDKDLDELQTNPKAVYAQMMARVHINAVSSVMRTVAQQMPVVVAGMLQAQARNSEAEGRFWSAYPQLNKGDPNVRQLVGRIARTVRAMNPNMPEGDMVRMTGAQAIVMMGLQGQAAPRAAQPPAPPQMPGRRVRQAPAPYQPAAARTQGGTPQRPNRNQWDVMAQLMQYDNQGMFDPNG
jgi:hypothetical protein